MNFFRNYLLPGFVFQSVLIGGGYATGRELIEFFFASGPLGGVLGLVVAGVIFGVVLAAGFEFARVTGAYDYKRFCRELLGPGWVVFEIAFLTLLLLILSVIGSAAGTLATGFGMSSLWGTSSLMLVIAVLTFSGSETIKRVLAGWSLLLYLVYATLFVLAFQLFGGDITASFREAPAARGWVSSGVLYSGYNLAILPAVLFAVAGLRTRRQTVGAGLLAGAIAVIPALLFFVAMMARHPEIGDQPVPASYLIAQLRIGWLELIFQIVVFGTFIETGTALLHAVNERIDAGFAARGRQLPRSLRPAVALAILLFAIYAGEQIGIVDLIARGYGALTLVFMAVLVVPLLTIGLWRVSRAGLRTSERPVASAEDRGTTT
ncbi:hypothetical protein Q6D67_15900 [Haliea sp. E1-2-M8]|uniref:YkvI family membrane protein n=1 Tax=Haliea sp. E1-2-M8 TaxID=3064706 RepID=UPI002723254E|nr:hypothetical protein [Haliea sp. E1-2-M8]MDO8863189.1 hypothetical protein [Haliea sp. E1-2-M8]